MNDSAYFRELMLRAPACPDWFKPKFTESHPYGEDGLNCDFSTGVGIVTDGPLKGKTEDFARKLYDEWSFRKTSFPLLQWPSFYARETLKAAGEDAINSEIKTT